jgi:hypothetical protein
LTTEIPDGETNIVVNDFLYVAADRGLCFDDFAHVTGKRKKKQRERKEGMRRESSEQPATRAAAGQRVRSPSVAVSCQRAVNCTRALSCGDAPLDECPAFCGCCTDS